MRALTHMALSVGILFCSGLVSAYGQGKDPYTIPSGVPPEAADAVKKAAARPTPHLPDGSIDLSGYWVTPGKPAGFGGAAASPKSGPVINVFPDNASVKNVNASDKAHADARYANKSLRPKYKPQYAAKAEENFTKGDLADPTFGCQLPGVVRLGLPAEIFQRPGSITLLYEGLVNRFRVIPTDGRKPEANPDPIPLGHPIGHWEQGTLVIESTGFMPDYWIDHDGSYNSEGLKLTERMTRQGDTLKYSMVADDPIFAEPFTAFSAVLMLGPKGQHVADEYGCDERDISHMVNGAKH
jgi:hypothetical protein